MGRRNILCLLCEVGGAHRMVAQVFQENFEADFEVEVIDLYGQISHFCSRSIKAYSPLLRGFPRLYNSFYDISNWGPGWDFCYKVFISRLMKEKTTEMLLDRRPCAVLSLSALTSRIAADSLDAAGLAGMVPLVTFIIDPFTIHRAWIEPRSNVILVASSQAKSTLLSRNLREDSIEVVKYPLRSGFYKSHDRRGIRAECAIYDGARVALVIGGGDGVIPADRIADMLLAMDRRMHVIAVAGRNAALARRLARAARRWGGRLKASGHSGCVHELMAISDLVITKPGPSTIMEAIESELPIVLTGFVPRQETGNAGYVLSRGLGVQIDQEKIGEAARLCYDASWIERVKASMRREKAGFPKKSLTDIVRTILDAPHQPGFRQVS